MTLSGAILFAEALGREQLQRNLRARQVHPGLPSWAGEGDVTIAVSTRSEDARYAVYESLQRMAAAAAGPGEAGQPPAPGLPAARTLTVLDTMAAAAARKKHWQVTVRAA